LSSVLAYLDAGSGSMILQLLLGGVAAIGVALKMYWNRFLRLLRIKKDAPADETPVTAVEADSVPAHGPEGQQVETSSRS
jgi:hypothetical protein